MEHRTYVLIFIIVILIIDAIEATKVNNRIREELSDRREYHHSIAAEVFVLAVLIFLLIFWR